MLFIPVYSLWQVEMRLQQKLGLGVFLCLSVVMIVTAVVKACGFMNHGQLDETWVFLWQQVEACVAIMMISLTAFRSIFLSSSSRPPRRSLNRWHFTSSKKKSAQNEEARVHLTIPKPTLTGIRSFIRGERLDRSQSSVTITANESIFEDRSYPHQEKQTVRDGSDAV